jgi:hypothetical protein
VTRGTQLSDSHDYFKTPTHGVALSDIHYGHAVLEAIERFESESRSVLVVSVPLGNSSPERMERFWDTARESPPDEPVRGPVTRIRQAFRGKPARRRFATRISLSPSTPS